jgi:hypothetical protein
VNQSTEVADLFTALSKAQAMMQGAKEDCKNPFYKSSYADLTSVWAAAREPLTKNGLCITQVLEMHGTTQCLVTILAHSSGQWIRSTLAFPAEQKDPQAIGKVITYYRRYGLAAIVGVCPEDDDAESAMQTVRKPSPPPNSSTPLFITPEQAQVISTMVNHDPARIQRIVDSYRVKDLTNIPQDIYKTIVAKIEESNRQKINGTQ